MDAGTVCRYLGRLENTRTAQSSLTLIPRTYGDSYRVKSSIEISKFRDRQVKLCSHGFSSEAKFLLPTRWNSTWDLLLLGIRYLEHS